jgi:hypothetical protein
LYSLLISLSTVFDDNIIDTCLCLCLIGGKGNFGGKGGFRGGKGFGRY